MADEPAKPRRLTVYAEVAAILALVVAIVGVVVAVFAFEHDKEVADGGQGANTVATATHYSPKVGSQETAEADSSSSGFWGTAGVVALTIITGLISSFLVFKSWEELVISDFIVVLINAAIAGMHTFVLSLMGITLIWAIVLAVVFAVIGFFASVFAT
ncbi:hypothetical protein AB0L53_09280 [Nonomuraea sp. NPDC052129]|uniref:hypothetical protein n=1 Tax=Nonomuraea sp. NPDC052129 TaxID=3154651 RepID=UPI00342EC4C8